MKEKTKENFKWTLVGIVCFVLIMGVMWVCNKYGEPDTALAFYRFQDNETYAAHINPKTTYLDALESPKKFFNTNDSTKFLIDNREKCTNITVKYSVTTEPVWTELGVIVDMGNNKYLVDCIKSYPNTTITYCISATNKKGEVEEFYFSYIIR